jgi:hypothetical protein
MSKANSADTAAPSKAAASGDTWKLRALIVGGAGLLITLIGLFAGDPTRVGLGTLIALVFWLSIGLGMWFLIMLFHLFDAGWGTVTRRPMEHATTMFPWIAGIFFILVIYSLLAGTDQGLWKWMNTENTVVIAGETATVEDDVLYHHKSAYLNNTFFILRSLLYFGIFIGVATVLRRASFSQDRDGDGAWTTVCRKWSAAGVILGALAATFVALDWIMTLEFHWFSTMFGVWFFSASMRAALAGTILLCLLLVHLGVFRGIFKQAHLYELGRLSLAFTVFWAYISFSQYFLIWNANIPEVTYWYVNREHEHWWWVGLALLFGHFFVPFLFLLFYQNKIRPGRMIFISAWILGFHLLDLYFNILPSKQAASGLPYYNFGIAFWDVAAFVGVGGICVWAFLNSYLGQKPIPVRDPRILESLHHHE